MLSDHKGDKLMGKVRNHIKYNEIITGEGHYYAIHDKSVFEVEYPGGTTEQLTTNIISENMLSKVGSEGHHYQVLYEVTDHQRDDSAITKVNGFIKSSNCNLDQNRTTRVWKLRVEWKDGSIDWVPLK